jgi:hypothetical protein
MSAVLEKPFTWSYSALRNFETCPKQHYHTSIVKDVVEPESPAIAAGHALHKAFELRVKSGTGLPLGYGQYEPMLKTFTDAPGVTYAEQRLALSSELRPAGYFAPNVWFRTVIDAAKVRADEAFAAIVDWKSGRPAEDTTQLQLMAATVLLHDPHLNTVKAALAYVTHKVWETETYTRADLRSIWAEILPRVERLKQARQANEFPPRPSGLCKRHCKVKACVYNGR